MTRAAGARQTQQQQPPPQAVTASSNGSFRTNQSDEFFDLQRGMGNRLVGEWLKAGLGNPIDPIIQRKPVNGGGAAGPAEQQADKAAEEATTPTEKNAVARPLIVEDDTRSLQPGQMKKSEFLSQLRTAACTTAEETLRGTMWSAMGCPHIERWFSHYQGQSATHVERAVKKYVPEGRNASSAGDYIPLVSSRLRRGIEQWRETGEVPPDVPPEFASGGMPGMTAGTLIGGLVGGALSAVGSAVSGAVSSVGRALFKEREGGVRDNTDPAAIRAQLGSGRALDGGAKSRMESAFGANFSSVRIHTDAKAQDLSTKLNARAFTVGSDIAFGAGEYKPGTLVGDALIAHELAHVAQQGGKESSASPLQKGAGESSALENEADTSAVKAVVGLWAGSKLALDHIGENAMPRLKSGLRLQKCSCGATPVVRNEADIQREFNAVRREILDPLPANSPTRLQLDQDLADAMNAYQFELAGAGNNVSRQAEIQRHLHDTLETMRETAPLQVRMTARYGIAFTARSTFIREPEVHQLHRPWTTEELRTVDDALSRVPRNYLTNIQTIERVPAELDPTVGPGDSTPPPHSAASFNQSTGTLQIYNRFFTRPDYERLGMILHEIGHSTVTAQVPSTVGGFTSLPPQAWMLLSDWQTATTTTLARSVGINQTQATELIADLTRNKRSQRGDPRPVEKNNRMIVYDKYETDDMNVAPTRFLHFQKDKKFVSDYAKTHPAEDLAESFRVFMHNPQTMLLPPPSAREQMGDDKFRYMQTNYRDRLQRPSLTRI